MAPFWSDQWGNASSKQHREGLKAAAAVNLAREKLASWFNVNPKQIIFTSGATEANNLALLGHARAKAKLLKKKGHLITLNTEHHAVLDPMRQLQAEGFELTEIRPEPDGLLKLDKLIQACKKETLIISVMVANNEIGVIQNTQEIAEICQKKGITFHSDISQAFGNLKTHSHFSGPDLMCLSAHKIYGPKGIGALVMNQEIILEPLHWGGGQENGIRPGTLPVPLIIGLAKAAELAMSGLNERSNRLKMLRNQLWENLKRGTPDLLLNGCLENRLPNNLNFTVTGVSGSQLHRALRRFVSCSSGSACTRGLPSHVLIALGRTKKEAEASLRLSLGRDTTLEEINRAAMEISKVIYELRNQ